MKVLNDRVFVKRGESFVLKFGDTDNVPPLVFGSRLIHPFIVLRIISTTYPQKGRYVMTRWLNCRNVLRFQDAHIMHLGTGSTINDVTIPSDDDGKIHDNMLKRVYSVTNDNGEIVYFYFFHYVEDPVKRKEYGFKFKVAFDNTDMQELVDNEYLVEVALVDGESTKELLSTICAQHNITATNMGDMFRALQNINAPELQQVEIDAPLSRLTLNIPLYQFKLYVEV